MDARSLGRDRLLLQAEQRRLLVGDSALVVRFFRGLKRDKVGAWALFKRIWAQRKMNPNDFASDADIFTISNIGSSEKTAEKIVKILEKRK